MRNRRALGAATVLLLLLAGCGGGEGGGDEGAFAAFVKRTLRNSPDSDPVDIPAFAATDADAAAFDDVLPPTAPVP